MCVPLQRCRMRSRGISARDATKQIGGSKMTNFCLRRRTIMSRSVFAAALFLTGGALAQDDPGAVYAMSNAAGGNSILIFDRAANGALTSAGSVATGGAGIGSGL